MRDPVQVRQHPKRAMNGLRSLCPHQFHSRTLPGLAPLRISGEMKFKEVAAISFTSLTRQPNRLVRMPRYQQSAQAWVSEMWVYPHRLLRRRFQAQSTLPQRAFRGRVYIKKRRQRRRYLLMTSHYYAFCLLYSLINSLPVLFFCHFRPLPLISDCSSL